MDPPTGLTGWEWQWRSRSRRRRGGFTPLVAARRLPRYPPATVNSPKIILLLAAVCSLAALEARAHGDAHLRINELTEQIKATNHNATLYFTRGELYASDGNWTNALADFDRVAQLDPALRRVDFCRGRVLFEAGRLPDALIPLDRYLKLKPPDAEAYAIRARVHMGLTNFTAAVADWNRAVELNAGSPELYISRAEAWRALGQLEEALRGLDQGIHALGPLVTLELPAVDLNLALKNYDAALARIDTVTARLQRQESWLVRRAEILQQAGRSAESRTNYLAALAALDRLPSSHRHTRATVELESRIRTALATNRPASLPLQK